jgi:hypothetical protein
MAESSGAPVSISVEAPDSLAALVAAMNAEADGKQLKKDLRKDIRASLKPSATAVKGNIRAMGSSAAHDGAPLRMAIARKVSIQIQMTKKTSGASVRVRKTRDVRGFPGAPTATNKPKWRRRVWGNPNRWADQVGEPGWFDDELRGRHDEYRSAVHAAMQRMIDRIISRAG